MKLYFFNHANQDKSHVISRIDASLYKEYKDSFLRRVDIGETQNEYVAFVHANEDETFREWAERARSKPNCIVIFCSSVPTELSATLQRLGIHESQNIRILTRNPEAFLSTTLEAFTQSVVSGTPDFSLIQASTIPEHLIGYKLLSEAKLGTQLAAYQEQHMNEISKEIEQLLGEGDKTIPVQERIDAALSKAFS